ncbi:MAG TPA: coenzyme F420-0:L-glutamate ligase [Geminicoccaceae bacterium]|nr:coenzyme F420-0:L-glutamate ligase [Geminicoccaceae bacterium]
MPASLPIARLEATALPGMPLVRPGDDLVQLIRDALARAGLALAAGDVLVLAQKIVSKAEGRLVRLDTVQPSADARRLAERAGKDPRLAEVILSESREVLRVREGLIIVRHRLGLVMANAGVDHSNVARETEGEVVLMLPEDPDASCARIGEALSRDGGHVGVIINDSVGRAWRRGQIGTAIGCWGLAALQDLRGRPDLFGRVLQASESALADQLASLAGLLQGQADEGRPVVLVRGGFAERATRGAAADLVRPPQQDLFR